MPCPMHFNSEHSKSFFLNIFSNFYDVNIYRVQCILTLKHSNFLKNPFSNFYVLELAFIDFLKKFN